MTHWLLVSVEQQNNTTSTNSSLETHKVSFPYTKKQVCDSISFSFSHHMNVSLALEQNRTRCLYQETNTIARVKLKHSDGYETFPLFTERCLHFEDTRACTAAAEVWFRLCSCHPKHASAQGTLWVLSKQGAALSDRPARLKHGFSSRFLNQLLSQSSASRVTTAAGSVRSAATSLQWEISAASIHETRLRFCPGTFKRAVHSSNESPRQVYKV